jgi:hypothetical protein
VLAHGFGGAALHAVQELQEDAGRQRRHLYAWIHSRQSVTTWRRRSISQNSKRGFNTKHRVQAIAERIHLANAVLGEIERGISSWPQIPNKSKKILDGKSENSSGGKFPGRINRLHQEESYPGKAIEGKPQESNRPSEMRLSLPSYRGVGKAAAAGLAAGVGLRCTRTNGNLRGGEEREVRREKRRWEREEKKIT